MVSKSGRGLFDATVMDMAFSPDGTQLIIAQRDGAIRILNVESFAVINALSHSGVHGIQFIDGGERLLSVDETSVRYWDWQTGTRLNTFTTPSFKSATDCDVVANDSTLIFEMSSEEGDNASEGTVIFTLSAPVIAVWDTATGSELTSSPKLMDIDEKVAIYCTRLSPVDADLALWTDSRPVLSLWDYGSNSNVAEVDLIPLMNPDAVFAFPNGQRFTGIDLPRQVTMSPDGTLIALAGIEVEIVAVR